MQKDSVLNESVSSVKDLIFSPTNSELLAHGGTHTNSCKKQIKIFLSFCHQQINPFVYENLEIRNWARTPPTKTMKNLTRQSTYLNPLISRKLSVELILLRTLWYLAIVALRKQPIESSQWSQSAWRCKLAALILVQIRKKTKRWK